MILQTWMSLSFFLHALRQVLDAMHTITFPKLGTVVKVVKLNQCAAIRAHGGVEGIQQHGVHL
jgi:hypothetical protein